MLTTILPTDFAAKQYPSLELAKQAEAKRARYQDALAIVQRAQRNVQDIVSLRGREGVDISSQPNHIVVAKHRPPLPSPVNYLKHPWRTLHARTDAKGTTVNADVKLDDQGAIASMHHEWRCSTDGGVHFWDREETVDMETAGDLTKFKVHRMDDWDCDRDESTVHFSYNQSSKAITFEEPSSGN